MSPRAVPTLLIALLLAGEALAQVEAAPDSTRPFPSRVRYRSTAEALLAVPGRIVYLPVAAATLAAGQLAFLLWERRLYDHLKDLLTTADGRAGIRPLSSTDLGAGARVFYKGPMPGVKAEITSTLGSSPVRRQHHRFALAWPGGVRFAAQFSREPKENFYGALGESLVEERYSFAQQDIYLGVLIRRRLSPALNLDGEVNYHVTEIGRGHSGSAPSLQIPEDLPGLQDRLHHVQAAVSLAADRVDVPGSPTCGNRTLLRFGYSQSMDEDQFSYLNLLAVTEQFRELFYRRTVSLRLGTEWVVAPGGNQIPFYHLAALGGNDFLRGYRRGRFRGDGTAFAAATYRFPIWRILDGLVFYETGRTLHEPRDLSTDDWRSSYGGGVCMWDRGEVMFRQLVARSDEQTRLIFCFQTVF